MTEEPKSYPVLLVGLEEKGESLVRAFFEGAQFTRVMDADDFESRFEQWGDGMFAAIFCGPAVSGIATAELAQVLQNQCPITPKYFITNDTASFEVRNLVKNGFHDVFLVPLDQLLLKKTITDISAGALARVYRPVQIFDLEPGTVLEFDTYVYLPLNKKYVKFTSSNQELDPEKIKRLSKREVVSLFVDKKDMEKFYQYAARNLRDLGDGAISSTERQERLQASIRSIFTEIFDPSVKGDFESGKQAMESYTQVISNFITKGASNDWYTRLMSTIGQEVDGYSHAKSVSAFAALFAIGLGHPHPEDLAMAGLFHDLGLATMPEELSKKKFSEMTEEEKKIYITHPEKSVNMVKQKRLIISPEVEKAILQHHEQVSGRGFPRGLISSRISEDAQILSFADQFDYLTRVEEGRPRLSPIKAWEAIRQTGWINLDLMARLRRLLEKTEKEADTQQPA